MPEITAQLRQVEPSVWRAAAGNSVTVPSVNSRVYYFPQGHSEHSSLSPSLSLYLSPMVPCCVASVLLLADTVTDEVFAKIHLIPYPTGMAPPADVAPAEQTVSFAKVLTPSDANNGGGFSVPRFCADAIFPPLDFTKDQPMQNLSIRDIHGTTWKFRHIYRGSPRRHLLTTGWSKFVNGKKLIAGDSVVFMRNVHSGELSVGIRRAMRCNPWSLEDSGVEGFWRGGRGVAEAADLAELGLGFEVVYYPRVGWADFVVGADLVDESLRVFWTVGMKVKMAMETEDSSRTAWFLGTVSAISEVSPWKMLEVAWDEPEYLQHLKRVSPWQVEHVLAPPPHSARPTKKSKFTRNHGFQPYGVRDLSFPISGLSNSSMGNFNPSPISYYSSPVGMQGVRQSQFLIGCLPNLISETNLSPKLKSVSTELTIHSSQSEILSPDSQSCEHQFGKGRQGFVSSPKAGVTSFQLFGKTIYVNGPEGNSEVAIPAEENGSTLIEEAERAEKTEGLSFNVSCKNMLSGHDFQRQGAPAPTFFLSQP